MAHSASMQDTYQTNLAGDGQDVAALSRESCTFIPATVNSFRWVQEIQLNDLILVLIAPAHYYSPLLACRSKQN